MAKVECMRVSQNSREMVVALLWLVLLTVPARATVGLPFVQAMIARFACVPVQKAVRNGLSAAFRHFRAGRNDDQRSLSHFEIVTHFVETNLSANATLTLRLSNEDHTSSVIDFN